MRWNKQQINNSQSALKDCLEENDLSFDDLEYMDQGNDKLCFRVHSSKALAVITPKDSEFPLDKERDILKNINSLFSERYTPSFQDYFETSNLKVLLMSYLDLPDIGSVIPSRALAYNLGYALKTVHDKTGLIHTDPWYENIKVEGTCVKFIDVISFQKRTLEDAVRIYIDNHQSYPMPWVEDYSSAFLEGLYSSENH